MIGVAEARERAAKLVTRELRAWASDPDAAAAAALRVPLGPPTEREALAALDAVRGWRDEWAVVSEIAEVAVTWEERAWPSVGRQRVPVRLEVLGSDSIAAFALFDAWVDARDRARVIRQRLGDGAEMRTAIRGQITRIAALASGSFDELVDVCAWLVQHPASGLRPRQVPVRGVDSKWLGTHRSIVTALVGSATGGGSLGLVDGDPLIRIRVLDPDLGGDVPRDFSAPPSELARLHLVPRTVLVLENLESVLALPAMEGVVAIHGAGFAVGPVAELPWVRASRVLYWGDLDSHGFAALHLFRSRLPGVESVLMDVDTLHAFRDLWVAEPSPTRAQLPSLTPAEASALAALRDAGDVRLEQERIPWGHALGTLRACVPAITAPPRRD